MSNTANESVKRTMFFEERKECAKTIADCEKTIKEASEEKAKAKRILRKLDKLEEELSGEKPAEPQSPETQEVVNEVKEEITSHHEPKKQEETAPKSDKKIK
jgi:hypothetical protein